MTFLIIALKLNILIKINKQKEEKCLLDKLLVNEVHRKTRIIEIVNEGLTLFKGLEIMKRLNFDTAPDVLSAHQTAELLGISDGTARKLLCLGEIKARKTGGKGGSGTSWLVPKVAVKEWLLGGDEVGSEK